MPSDSPIGNIRDRLEGEAALLDAHTAAWVCHLPPLLRDASAEIARLQDALRIEHARANGWRDKFNSDTDEIERLRAALQKIVDQDWWEPSSKQGDEPDAVDGRCAEIARAALEGSAT